MDGPNTPAGRDLLSRHPGLTVDEVLEVELQARGRGLQADAARRDRVVDALRHVLTGDQLAAVTAVQMLDPDTVATLDDEKIRIILRELADPRMNLDRGVLGATRAASARFLEEIM